MLGLKTREREAPTVEVKHIPYVEGLWNDLVEAKATLASREEYLKTASQLGLKVNTVDGLAEDILADYKAVSDGGKALNRIKHLLAMGAEPTEVPAHWYCGHIEAPKKIKISRPFGNDEKWYPNETWPHQWVSNAAALVFNGPIPLNALRRYAAAKPYVDGARIYSPNINDFSQLRNPKRLDPVLIGSVYYLGQNLYFEIARWDIDKDLEQVFSAPK